MPADAPVAPARFTNEDLARLLSALFIAAATAIFMFAAIAGVTDGPIIPLLSAGVTAVVVGFLQWGRPPSHRFERLFTRVPHVSTVAAVVALIFISRLTVFMVDPSRTAYSTVPSSDWEVRHSCLTAYFVAGDVVRRTPNVYDTSLYAAPDDDPRKPRRPQTIGIFRVDQVPVPAFVSARAACPLDGRARISSTAIDVVRAERSRAARWFTRRCTRHGAGCKNPRTAAHTGRAGLARHAQHAPEGQRAAGGDCRRGHRDGGDRAAAASSRRRAARRRHRREALSGPAHRVPAGPARLARPDVDRRFWGCLRGAYRHRHWVAAIHRVPRALLRLAQRGSIPGLPATPQPWPPTSRFLASFSS